MFRKREREGGRDLLFRLPVMDPRVCSDGGGTHNLRVARDALTNRAPGQGQVFCGHAFVPLQ